MSSPELFERRIFFVVAPKLDADDATDAGCCEWSYDDDYDIIADDVNNDDDFDNDVKSAAQWRCE